MAFRDSGIPENLSNVHFTNLIPIAKLLYHIRTTEKKGTCCVLQRKDWGGTVGNAVSGSRFIPDYQPCNVISVWDCSRVQARVAQQLQTSVSEYVPFAQNEVALPAGISGGVSAALSEDAIVIREASVVAHLSTLLFTVYPTDLHS